MKFYFDITCPYSFTGYQILKSKNVTDIHFKPIVRRKFLTKRGRKNTIPIPQDELHLLQKFRERHHLNPVALKPILPSCACPDATLIAYFDSAAVVVSDSSDREASACESLILTTTCRTSAIDRPSSLLSSVAGIPLCFHRPWIWPSDATGSRIKIPTTPSPS
ncbi:hypothetical protein L596_000381 [Steinernema carpocapsae]|uniref:DSBA-like thioredoxin domain-containing protein n=1 Tax=Steinernema carpocapsae TaxID=34508 RepID=A0A4U8UJD2_STECR|nr:hypothetical protein L596_000381 [Steinernema carpocapsae]